VPRPPHRDKQTLIDEIVAWQHDRNSRHTKANWHFTTANARIKGSNQAPVPFNLTESGD
jgi:hypothetical protein